MAVRTSKCQETGQETQKVTYIELENNPKEVEALKAVLEHMATNVPHIILRYERHKIVGTVGVPCTNANAELLKIIVKYVNGYANYLAHVTADGHKPREFSSWKVDFDRKEANRR